MRVAEDEEGLAGVCGVGDMGAAILLSIDVRSVRNGYVTARDSLSISSTSI